MASVVVDRTGGDVQLNAALGATWHDTVTVYSDAAQTTPLNMSGYSFQMQLRTTREESGTLLASSGASTITIGTGSVASGIVTWSIASTTTDDITERTVWAELWWQTSGGVREPLLTYQITVEPRTTVWA